VTDGLWFVEKEMSQRSPADDRGWAVGVPRRSITGLSDLWVAASVQMPSSSAAPLPVGHSDHVRRVLPSALRNDALGRVECVRPAMLSGELAAEDHPGVAVDRRGARTGNDSPSRAVPMLGQGRVLAAAPRSRPDRPNVRGPPSREPVDFVPAPSWRDGGGRPGHAGRSGSRYCDRGRDGQHGRHDERSTHPHAPGHYLRHRCTPTRRLQIPAPESPSGLDMQPCGCLT
jgi:hypothetical protein